VFVALCSRTLRVFFGFFLKFFSSHPSLLEVVQRARPSFNPKGKCLRWAESPAAPSETKLCNQQFQSTRDVGKKCSSHRGSHRQCILALAEKKCSSHFANDSLQSNLALAKFPLRCSLLLAMFIAFFSEPLTCPQFPSAQGRKKKGRKNPETRGEEKRSDEETPNFLKDSAHVPGETPHVQQETPHDPQGTPHEPQAGGQVSQGGS
jgi:hypothetical protein